MPWFLYVVWGECITAQLPNVKQFQSIYLKLLLQQHTVFLWESQHGLLSSSSSATLSCFWGTLRHQWTCPEQLSRVDLSEASLSDNWTTSFGNFTPSSPPGCLGSSPHLQMLCQAVLQMNLTHLWPCPYSHLAGHVNACLQVNILSKLSFSKKSSPILN